MAHETASYLELCGTHYEIGQRLGTIAASIPPLKAFYSSGTSALSSADAASAMELVGEWCPGMNEEIQGFSDVLGVEPAKSVYYGMTYLIPRCSHIAVLPGLSDNGHVLVARSYEFSEKAEDFTLVRTSAAGKYAHIGTSVIFSGRDEGFNEKGLAVTMSSCGFPVGAPEGMRAPRLRGLQFWAVVRTLLENCVDVEEALRYLEDMPIAYNINLLLTDRAGHTALFETWDGNKGVLKADSGGKYLCAANHILVPALKNFEPQAMHNSVQRISTIRAFLDGKKSVSADDLKALLLRPYPEGLCCHDYRNYFGTTKSIVMDVSAGTMEVCWGGLADNGWVGASINEPLQERLQSIAIVQEDTCAGFFDMVSI